MEQNFGGHKSMVSGLYRAALEQALIQADFLCTAEIATLQALCLYVLALRHYEGPRKCWAMTGLVIRIAQSMGLHRDGELLGLSPLETEIRRRVWWVVVTLDVRCAEETGSGLAIFDFMFDAKLPSCIDDSTITASSKMAPSKSDSWSDCTASVIRFELSDLVRHLLSSGIGPSIAVSHSLDRVETDRLLDASHETINKLLGHVDSDSDPLRKYTAIIARILLAKAFLVAPQNLKQAAKQDTTSGILDLAYLTAVEAIECNVRLLTDPSYKQYVWLSRMYFNWRFISIVLRALLRCPWTAQSERGWQALNGFERSPVDTAKITDRIALLIPLRRLFTAVKIHRDAEYSRLRADPEEARRLAHQERMTPYASRFGASPIGVMADRRMDAIRQQWTELVEPSLSMQGQMCLQDTGLDTFEMDLDVGADADLLLSEPFSFAEADMAAFLSLDVSNSEFAETWQIN